MSRLAAIREGRSLGAKISGEGVVPGEYFFGFYKTRHILLSDSANCTVLCAIVLTQYRRVTDGQTDGNAKASTAFAMRALRRGVNEPVYRTTVVQPVALMQVKYLDSSAEKHFVVN